MILRKGTRKPVPAVDSLGKVATKRGRRRLKKSDTPAMATEQTNTLRTITGGIASRTRSKNITKEPLYSQLQVKNKG